LDPAQCAFRQWIAFDADAEGLESQLSRSPLFRRGIGRGKRRFEWIRFHLEDEEAPFPLGRVSLSDAMVILESVTPEREMHLQRSIDAAWAGRLSGDETRVLSWEDALARPQALAFLDTPWTVKEVAAFFLRFEWTFLAREDLRKRAPFEVAATESGRSRLEEILGTALDQLRREFPTFPELSAAQVKELLALGAKDPQIQGASRLTSTAKPRTH
jgi:hypothetical protein